MHAEVPVKVTAYVDAGIAPLVAALNEFPNVLTLDSCEESRSDSRAYVCFGVRGEPSEAFAFVQHLSSELGSRLRPCCEYCLQLEWGAGAEHPMARLTVQRDYVPTLARGIAEVALAAPV